MQSRLTAAIEIFVPWGTMPTLVEYAHETYNINNRG